MELGDVEPYYADQIGKSDPLNSLLMTTITIPLPPVPYRRDVDHSEDHTMTTGKDASTVIYATRQSQRDHDVCSGITNIYDQRINIQDDDIE
jgi:hypothetical protein